MSENLPVRTVLCVSASCLLVLLAGCSPPSGKLTSQLIPVKVGECEGIPVDEETGVQNVYCCIDEAYIMEKEATPEEFGAYLQDLLATQQMEDEDVRAFYENPYISSIHEKYGWTSPCGPQIDCGLCVWPEDREVTEPRCGDVVIQGNEECDDGNADDIDECSNSCMRNATFPGLALLVCGNGIIEEGEVCDDGNSVDGDGCSARCRKERRESDYEIVAEEGAPSVCGNGIIEEGEVCDDGNSVDGDGCSALCTIENVERTEAVCGNGIIEEGEVCDDGNSIDGDGCSLECKEEQMAEVSAVAADICFLEGYTIPAGTPLPSGMIFPDGITIPPNAVFPFDISDGNKVIPAGTPLPTQVTFPPGTKIEVAMNLPYSITINKRACYMRGTDFVFDLSLPTGEFYPATIAIDERVDIPPQAFLSRTSTYFPAAPSTQPLYPDIPLTSVTPIAVSRGPAGNTGPAAIAFMAAGAAAGFGWMRRKHRK